MVDCHAAALEAPLDEQVDYSLEFLLPVWLGSSISIRSGWLEESSISIRDRGPVWKMSFLGLLGELKNTSDVNFTLTSSESGFVMHVGSSTIHVPKYLSVNHPVAKMVLLAKHSNGLHGGNFSCPKSVVPKGITSMVNRQPSSASPNVYEAGWVPSRQLRRHAFNPVETATVKPLPVLFEKSTDEVTASNVSSTAISVMADEAEMKPLHAAAGAQDSVNFVLDSGSSVLPTGISLHQHYVLNDQTGESSGKPRPNNAPAIHNYPLHEAARTPVAHKRTEEDSEHHSNPNPCVTEHDIFEKTKRSDTWYVATGAAHHATGNRQFFTILEVENSDLCVHAADGTPMPVCGRGNVVTDTVVLSDVWYVPGLDVNLVSVGQLAELDYSIGFARGSCTICNACDTVVGRARAREDGLYEVDFLRVPLGMP